MTPQNALLPSDVGGCLRNNPMKGEIVYLFMGMMQRLKTVPYILHDDTFLHTYYMMSNVSIHIT